MGDKVDEVVAFGSGMGNQEAGGGKGMMGVGGGGGGGGGGATLTGSWNVRSPPGFV